jgi:hypothetical protein
MTKPTGEPLRGDALWQAQRQQIRKNNEAAHARARDERHEKAARQAARQRAAENREYAALPKQPGRNSQ